MFPFKPSDSILAELWRRALLALALDVDVAGLRLRREELLADLSRQTLERPGIEEVLQQAVELAREGLGADLAVMLEHRSGSFVVRAGDGLPVAASDWTLPDDPDSQFGYTVESGEVVAVEDAAADFRFAVSEPLRELRVRARLSVPIRRGERAWGVLGALWQSPHRFGADDVAFIRLVANTIGAALENARALAQAKQFSFAVAENAPDIIVRFDRGRRHPYVSPVVTKATAPAPEHFVGRTNRELGVSERQCALWERELGAVFELGEPRRFEFEFECSDGPRLFEAHAVPERNAAGEIETVISFTRDRTEARRGELEQLASETRYRELFELAMDMIILIDRAGHVVDANPAAQRALGYSREQLIGQPYDLFVAPEQVGPHAGLLARKLDGSEPASVYTSEFVSKDGRRMAVEASSRVIIRDGEPAGVLVITRDITERHVAEAALQESERRFRSAFDEAAVGMMLTDPTGTLLRVNSSFARTLGYQPEELAGMTVFEITHAEDIEASAADIEQMNVGLRDRLVIEKRYRRKDGELVWGHVGVSPVRADDGSVRYFVAQVEDVTELRRVRQELEESEALHRVVIESSRDLLAVLDLDSTIRLVSRSVQEMLGFAPEELVGRKFGELLHPDDLDGARTAMQAALNAEEVPIILGRVCTKEGGYKLLEGTAAAGFDRDGRPAFVVMSSRDVTERAQLEEQLRQSQKMEAIGRLAGGIAHDFNNLLLAIRGFGELALRRLARGEDDASADIEDMLDAASRAADLTRQLLALSRRQVMHPELLDLRAVVDQMVKLLRRLIGDSVELSTAWPDAPVLVKADQAQLEQVIVNLAVNARDAMPDGGRLSIDVIADSVTDQGRALLIVSDCGVGMDAETTARIFEPFFTTKGELGTGLGLATVHGIVTQTGGEIAVESTPGSGTTFTIALPLGEGAPRAKPPAEAAARPGTETILLVEDDPAVRLSVARTLEEYGYGVISAESGEAAIAICGEAATSVDLLLTDLMMRGLNGRDTAERIRVLQPLARVLFMSGYTDDLAIPVRELEPRTAFIAKPFNGDDLARRIRELLDPRLA